ncbi:MAG: NirD/YgiW/YdeI family stress tolerance protein [Deltaproteobacteria bacterium]|jgi:uncharacterized protein (TIGR00156 family)|nr:NirD/YgiW/YdeI family stress tolerance protein [Deltaproteobacteria bacterium]
MRKSFFFLVVSLVAIGALFGQPQAQVGSRGDVVGQPGGGFSGPSEAFTTVDRALKLPDNASVVLKGHIIRHLGKDRYIFRDETGEINVDIDSDKWRGQLVKPEVTVEIKGEIDKDRNNVEVEVDQITIIE